MAKVTRKVIKIDEDLCNGCGQCVPSCAEGAIQIIDGKARLVSDKYCDGLGACLGECPMGALSFEEREADEFDMNAVEDRLKGLGRSLDEHNARHQEHALPKAAPAHHGGCPGSRMMQLRREHRAETPAGDTPKLQSELMHWPVKLNLLNPAAPYLQGADLVLTADCAAYAYASFHPDFMKGKAIAIGCPKFDDVQAYIAKLRDIILYGGIKSIKVVHMEVPCCTGLVYAAQKAIEAAGVEIPFEDVVISIQGDIKDAPMFGGL